MSFVGQRRALVRPLVPHLIWEGVLLVALLLVIVIVQAAEPRLWGDSGGLWSQWAVIGLMGSAVALSLRMATPNLAVAAVAAAGGVWFVDRVNDGLSVPVAAFVAILMCLAHGLVLGAFVGATGVPAWAASLGMFALLQAYLTAHTRGQITGLRGSPGQYDLTWFLLFVMVSLIGAIGLATPAVRARIAQAGSAGVSSRLVTSLIGLGGSSAIAGLVGVLIARRAQSSSGVVPFDLLLLALGVALVAGVSVYGGQGPIFGVVLASGIATMISHWNIMAGRPAWAQFVLAGVMILVGLLAGWLIGLFTRRMLMT
jgi:ribose/xylose/arabinose/galactoside ABC-type transport system permease subunit